MELIEFLLLGIAAGILSGLFGIGGGIVMVPTLIAIFGMDILNAIVFICISLSHSI